MSNTIADAHHSDVAPQGAHNRRQDVRLAGAGAVDAVVVDRYRQPIRVLEGARVVNVSAGGMALRTHAPVAAGSRIVVTVDGARPTRADERCVRLEAIASHEYEQQVEQSCLVHCRLVEGRMPARLIYRWS